jgi:hypothetical protein
MSATGNKDKANLQSIQVSLCLCLLLTACKTYNLQPVPQASLTPLPSAPLTTPPASSPSETPTPTPSQTPMVRPTFDLEAVADWSSGELIFDIATRSFGERGSLGIFKLDLSTGELSEILGKGSQLQDISPDLKAILATQGQNLAVYALDGELITPLASDYFSGSPAGARWIRMTDEFLYIADDGQNRSLLSLTPDGKLKGILTSDEPLAIAAADQDLVVWTKGTCNSFGDCTVKGISWTALDGSSLAEFDPGPDQILPCQSPSSYLYSHKDDNNVLSLHVHPLNELPETIFWAANTEYSHCDWSPDLTRLAVVVIDRGWYSGTIKDYFQQILLMHNQGVIDLPANLGPTDKASWSPDGNYLLFTGTASNQDQYQLVMRIMDTGSFLVTNLDEFLKLSSVDYITVNQIFWLP